MTGMVLIGCRLAATTMRNLLVPLNIKPQAHLVSASKPGIFTATYTLTNITHTKAGGKEFALPTV